MNLSTNQQKFKAFLLTHTDLTETEINELIAKSTELHLAKGECFAEEGRHCKQIGFVVSGVLYAIATNAAGTAYVSSFYEPDQLVTAYKSYHEDITSCCSVITLQASTVLVIDRDVLKNLLPPAYEKELLLAFLHTRYLFADEHATELATLSVAERYNHFLKHHGTVANTAPKTFIASHLGASRGMLSR